MKKRDTNQFNLDADVAAGEPARDKDIPLAGQTDWEYLIAMSGEEAYRNALADEDNPPLTVDEIARMRPAPNPRTIRSRLNMTQKEFARQFEISLGALRDWEQGLHFPDSTAIAYLRVIEQIPRTVTRALHASVAKSPEAPSSDPDAVPASIAVGDDRMTNGSSPRWSTEPSLTRTIRMETNLGVVHRVA